MFAFLQRAFILYGKQQPLFFYRVVAKVQFLRTLWEETSYREVPVTQIVCFLVAVQFEALLSLCFYIGLVIYSRRSWLIKHSLGQTVKL